MSAPDGYQSWGDWAMAQAVTDPRKDPHHCWSMTEVDTPDAVIRTIACQRGRHRWGRHTNNHVTWKCPKRCACVRHPQPAPPRRPQRRTHPAQQQNGQTGDGPAHMAPLHSRQ